VTSNSLVVFNHESGNLWGIPDSPVVSHHFTVLLADDLCADDEQQHRRPLHERQAKVPVLNRSPLLDEDKPDGLEDDIPY